MQKILRIGIDFGGVLSIHDCNNNENNRDKENKENKSEEKCLGQHKSTKIDMPDALDILDSFKETKLNGIDKIEYYLISFAGKKRAQETFNAILAARPNLFSHMYFTKSKQNKKYVCSYLGIDVMIDDTIDILIDIAVNSKKNNNLPHLFLFTGDPSYYKRNDIVSDKDRCNDNGIIISDSWSLMIEKIKDLYDGKTDDTNNNKDNGFTKAINEIDSISKYIYQIM